MCRLITRAQSAVCVGAGVARRLIRERGRLGLLVVVLVAALLVYSDTRLSQVSAQGAGPGDVLFVLDTSGSMGEQGGVDAKGNPLTRLEVARQGFPKAMQKAEDYASFLGISLGNFAAIVFGKAPHCSNPTPAVKWGPVKATKPQIQGILAKLKPEDATPLAAALGMAADELKKQINPAMVLVSDGIETCKNRATAEAAAKRLGTGDLAKKLRGKYVIFFIPAKKPGAGTALETALKGVLNTLDALGRKMKANLIALVNNVAGFTEALDGTMVEATDPAPELGRLHATRVLDKLLRVSVYIKQGSDNIIDPGETVKLGFRFVNISSQRLEDIELTRIETDNPDILPKIAKPKLGNVDSNQELKKESVVEIKVVDKVKKGTTFKLNLGLKAKENDPGSLEFVFEVGTLLTPQQYPTPQASKSELSIAFWGNATEYLSQRPGRKVMFLLNGPKNHKWALLWSTDRPGSESEAAEVWQGVRLELGKSEVVTDVDGAEGVGTFSKQGTAAFQFKVPDAQGKTYYFQAVTIDPPIYASNVLTLHIPESEE